jgi:serine/threonine-protein phosphatase Stp1
MIDQLRINDEIRSDTGCVRAVNEDSSIALPRVQVWVVADGMGGHVNGKHASETVIATVNEADFPDELDDACATLSEAIHAANGQIYAEARAAGSQMGSTVVSLVIRAREFAVLWAGDSRAYVYRDHALHQLTQDHSQVQEMVERGLLTPEQAIGHPMGHVLARAVGVEETLKIDAIRDEIVPGDIFLLCSDGLHGTLSDEEIAGIIEHAGSACAEILIAACIDRGAPDNVTVALVSATEPTTLALARSLNTQ